MNNTATRNLLIKLAILFSIPIIIIPALSALTGFLVLQILNAIAEIVLCLFWIDGYRYARKGLKEKLENEYSDMNQLEKSEDIKYMSRIYFCLYAIPLFTNFAITYFLLLCL